MLALSVEQDRHPALFRAGHAHRLTEPDRALGGGFAIDVFLDGVSAFVECR
jgi:hypothetical protein